MPGGGRAAPGPAAAPASASAAATRIAGAKPSVNADAEAKLPAPAKTATATAIPNTPPSSRIMLLAPAALPIAHRDRADDRVLRGRDRHRDADAGDDERREHLRVRHARLGDQREPGQPDRLERQPPTISGRSPIRSAIAPAIGATVMNVAVQGSSRSPASSGP